MSCVGRNGCQKKSKKRSAADQGKSLTKTETGLPMKYTVEGGEIFFNRKEKSVTRATVVRAFNRARQIQKTEGRVSDPKKLETFGASYLYPIFLRFGVCSSTPKGVN